MLLQYTNKKKNKQKRKKHPEQKLCAFIPSVHSGVKFSFFIETIVPQRCVHKHASISMTFTQKEYTARP